MKGGLDMEYESQRWFDYADSVPIIDNDGKRLLNLFENPKGCFSMLNVRITSTKSSIERSV